MEGVRQKPGFSRKPAFFPPSQLVSYPGEGPGIRQPRHQEDVLRRTLAWFQKYDIK